MTMTRSGPPADALTVDVEEYFHATIFQGRIDRKEWDRWAGRAAGAVERLVDRFERWDVRATFFVLGWFAERNGALIRAIAEAGHEIGAHGWDHNRIFDQSPATFREDIRRTAGVLGEITGEKVTSYRAPTFSVTARTLWALPILAEEGFLYDSSIFPIRHDRYGIPRFPRRPTRIVFPGGSIAEFPLSTWALGPLRIPVAGGGYLRQLPLSWIERGLEAVRRETGASILYIHPWEIDPDQPRILLPWLSRIRHYRRLATAADRLERLVAGRAFAPVREVLAGMDLPELPLSGIENDGSPSVSES